ncbi:MAG: ATP-binding cassette domain-containing protein [Gammaproteobacteria bacterium]
MIRADGLALRRGVRLLFSDASFQIHPGQKVGITGANGTGKSSLFSLIKNELHADEGMLDFPEQWVIAHVEQETPSDSRAAIEYVLDGDQELRQIEQKLALAEQQDDGDKLATLHSQYEHVGGYTARSRAAQLMHGIGFHAGDEDRPVSGFSGGWRMRLNLIKALMCRSDLLLLDEPTNHLDLDAVIWLENWLRQWPGTLLLISHDREFLDAIVNQIAHIEQQGLTLYGGNYSAFEKVRAEKLAHQQINYEKQQREITHIQSFITRFKAKATKARQAQSRVKALQRMQIIAPAHIDSPFSFSFFEPDKLSDPLLKLENLSAGYDGNAIIENVNLSLSPGDRIGLLGANGAGKSTLIKAIVGVLTPLSGDCLPSRHLQIGYFAQHQLEQLRSEWTPLQHLQSLAPDDREQSLRDYLGRFAFTEKMDEAVGSFSGGERSRLSLALLIYQRPNLLVLDEPTNHLDIDMRQALGLTMQNYSGAVILVSHDRYLLQITCDELLLVDDKKVEPFNADLEQYPDWLANRKKQANTTDSEITSEPGISRKESRRLQAEQRKRLQPITRKITDAESQMTDQQQRLDEIEQLLASQELYLDENKAQLKQLLLEKSELDKQLQSLEMIWMDLSEELEILQSG